MEPHVYVRDIAGHEGREVLLRGWLYGKRSSGKLHFIELRDGTGIVQCVMGRNDVPPEVFAAADHITQESSLEASGLETDVAGSFAVYSDVNEITSEDLERAELISMPVVILLAFLIFGSLVAASMPALVGLLSPKREPCTDPM